MYSVLNINKNNNKKHHKQCNSKVIGILKLLRDDAYLLISIFYLFILVTFAIIQIIHYNNDKNSKQ